MKLARSHRVAYELSNGPIPDGAQVDHTCHNADVSCGGGVNCPHRRCCNPAHLEAVPGTTNRSRGRGPSVTRARHAGKTHCQNNHEFTPENTYQPPGRKHRQCRTCKADANRQRMSTPEGRAANLAAQVRYKAKLKAL